MRLQSKTTFSLLLLCVPCDLATRTQQKIKEMRMRYIDATHFSQLCEEHPAILLPATNLRNCFRRSIIGDFSSSLPLALSLSQGIDFGNLFRTIGSNSMRIGILRSSMSLCEFYSWWTKITEQSQDISRREKTSTP
jgi:hypothetical protein